MTATVSPKSTDPAPVTLRPVTAEDGDILLGWQRDANIRRHFRNPNPVTPGEHAAWMEKRLAEPAGDFMLVLSGGTPAGMARLDQGEPGVYEVSILVDPAHQGRGIGKAALLALRRLRPGAVFRAEVMAGNTPSVALFRAAGFVPENGTYIQRPVIRAVFRADASPDIGGGHVMRCLTLADRLSKAGWGCAFAIRAQTLSVVPVLAQSGHCIIELDCPVTEEPEAIAGNCGDAAEWLVVDHYERDRQFEKACRAWARQILAIDDLVDRPHDCDLLLDQAPGRTTEDYRALTGAGCDFLMGPDYALLRPQFSEAREAVRGHDKAVDGTLNILVALGAVDAENHTKTVLQALAKVDCEAEIDVVLGPDAPHMDEIHELARLMPYKIRVHTDVRDMAGMMIEADLAVGAAGTSSWERCCLGLPSIVIMTADNQQDFAAALRKFGAAEVLDGREHLSTNILARKIGDIVNDRDRMKVMAAAAAKVCDGLGSERVFSAMAAAVQSPEK